MIARVWRGFSAAADAALFGHERAARWLTAGALLWMTLGVVAAMASEIMLHADGAFFVYALSAGEAWELKWRHIAARAATYVLTVWPVERLHDIFRFSPLELARLNALFFYGVPVVQFALTAALAWRTHPWFLLLPVCCFALVSGLGWGFPSEIALAPGFLFLCLALTLRGRAFGIAFLLSFAGLVFSHEVAAPAALVAAVAAVLRVRDADGGRPARALLLAALCAACFAAMLAVRALGGGAGSDANAIYVIDPRRVLNHPTGYLILAGIGAAVALIRFRPYWSRGPALVAILLAAFAAPLLVHALAPGFDFEQGRYDSARSLIAGAMLLLALVFVAAPQSRSEPAPAVVPTGAPPRKAIAAVPVALAAALALQAGAAVAFLQSWGEFKGALARTITEPGPNGAAAPAFVPAEEAFAAWSPAEALAARKFEFGWTLHFRSIVLADGATPQQIVYLKDMDHSLWCEPLAAYDSTAAAIPVDAIEALRSFACAYPPPPPHPPGLFQRFKQWLAGLLS